MIRGMAAAFVLLAALAVAGTWMWPPGNSVVPHAAQTYRFVHYAPSRPEVDPVVLVVLHGYGGNAEDMRRRTGLDRLARLHGFDVVYVQGLPDDVGIAHWNVGLGLTYRDDVSFLSSLIVSLQTEFGFAPEHTFVVGESNGGYMAYALACEAQGLIGGFASVIGTMSKQTWDSCDPVAPVPGLHLHGALDDLLYTPELDGEPNIWLSPAPAHEVAARWAALSGDAAPRDFNPVSWSMERDWRDPAGDLVARYYEVSELAHEWPQMNTIGIDGAEVVWAFVEEVLRQ